MIKKYFSFDVSSLCDIRELFLQALSQPVLSDLGGIVYSRVRFEVSGPVLSPGGDSVRPGLNRLVSGGVSDGDWLLVTTSACTSTGGLVLCDWLHSVTRGSGLWLIQSAWERAPLLAEAGQDVYGLCTLLMDQLKFGGSRCHWSSEFWCVFWLLSFFTHCDWYVWLYCSYRLFCLAGLFILQGSRNGAPVTVYIACGQISETCADINPSRTRNNVIYNIHVISSPLEVVYLA